jgi:hypothetical protein
MQKTGHSWPIAITGSSLVSEPARKDHLQRKDKQALSLVASSIIESDVLVFRGA